MLQVGGMVISLGQLEPTEYCLLQVGGMFIPHRQNLTVEIYHWQYISTLLSKACGRGTPPALI